MDKVSHIIPPSARPVWVSGEIEKPRRVADPEPGEERQLSQRSEMARPRGEMAAEAIPVLEGSGHKGTKLNTKA